MTQILTWLKYMFESLLVKRSKLLIFVCVLYREELISIFLEHYLFWSYSARNGSLIVHFVRSVEGLIHTVSQLNLSSITEILLKVALNTKTLTLTLHLSYQKLSNVNVNIRTNIKITLFILQAVRHKALDHKNKHI